MNYIIWKVFKFIFKEKKLVSSVLEEMKNKITYLFLPKKTFTSLNKVQG